MLFMLWPFHLSAAALDRRVVAESSAAALCLTVFACDFNHPDPVQYPGFDYGPVPGPDLIKG